jgi:hypothetical protein
MAHSYLGFDTALTLLGLALIVNFLFLSIGAPGPIVQ